MRRVNEELNSNDASRIADGRIKDSYSSSEFEKAVRKVAADVVEDLFKTLYYRSSNWKGGLK